MSEPIKNILDFMRQAEQLKNTLRSAHTSNGRHESTAEHSWRLCLLMLVLEEEYPDIDMLKLLKMGILHDLGEAIHGDIAAIDQIEGNDKSGEERRDLQTLLEPLSPSLQASFLEIWDEYEAAQTKEAKLAKALDKIETILQHTQGDNPKDFNYGFNLHYGMQYTDFDQIIRKLRVIIDEDTRALARETNTL